MKSIITLTPYRICLGGGGTDLPFYSNLKGGVLITAAIDQYVTISAAFRPLDDKILIQTIHENQFAKNLDEVHNYYAREVLRHFNIENGIQIATYSTLPTGLGLGSSSTWTVGLVKAVSMMAGKNLNSIQIASIAHNIERNVLKLDGGVQDQYIAALGGIQTINVDTNGNVTSKSIKIRKDKMEKLEKGLVLITTGIERNSSEIIKSQQKNISKATEIYDGIKEIGQKSKGLLKSADIEGLGKAMDEHWRLKKGLSKKMTNNVFDEMYIKLKKLGSSGGKMMGAGGGGFFMMAVPENVEEYIKKITNLGYRHLGWGFEFNGTHMIYSEI